MNKDSFTFTFPICMALFIYLFIYLLFRGGGREKEGERNINQLPLAGAQVGTWPATLTRNQTGDLSLRRPALNPKSHTSQGPICMPFLVFPCLRPLVNHWMNMVKADIFASFPILRRKHSVFVTKYDDRGFLYISRSFLLLVCWDFFKPSICVEFSKCFSTPVAMTVFFSPLFC